MKARVFRFILFRFIAVIFFIFCTLRILSHYFMWLLLEDKCLISQYSTFYSNFTILMREFRINNVTAPPATFSILYIQTFNLLYCPENDQYSLFNEKMDTFLFPQVLVFYSIIFITLIIFQVKHLYKYEI